MSSEDVRNAPTRPEVVAGISCDEAAVQHAMKKEAVENDGFGQAPELAEPSPRLFSLSTLKIAIPVIIAPTLMGYGTGVVGVYLTLLNYATNCQLYGAQTPCETLSGAKCQWMDATTVDPASTLGMVCGWQAPKTTCFLRHGGETNCNADSDCVWSYASGTCGNRVGYTSIQSGLFAGSMIIGCTIGSFAGGYLTKWLDYRKSFFIFGLISLIGSVLTHVAMGIFQYWLLFVARIIVGFAMGWQSVAAPHYTGKFAPRLLQTTLRSLFSVFACFGIFVAAVVGICVGNTIGYNADTNAALMGRIQGFIAPSTFLSILVMLLPLVMRDGYSVMEGDSYEEETAGSSPKTKAKTYSCGKMLVPLLLGITIAVTSQLTGFMATMNYAPTIMSNLGLDGLVGNVILMAWNSLMAFGVIPLSKKFSMRTLFLFCTLVGSLCCLFLGGVPVYPGVTKVKMAKDMIAIIGIALFITVYECGIGPGFFVLAMDVFPESFRPIGSSVTTGVMFSLILIINICYPIATEGMSGGPSGNQDKGQAIAFIFFGCIGLITFVIEFFFLHPWEEKEDSAASEPLREVDSSAEMS